MPDSPEVVEATVEIVRLYRQLLSEIRWRERIQSAVRTLKFKIETAETECNEAKAELASREKLWTEVKEGYEKELAELREENGQLKERLSAIKGYLPKMKEDDRGNPRRCLRCGKNKGHRAYTCPKCFDLMHQEGVDEERTEWRKLRDDWQAGARDFPRP